MKKAILGPVICLFAALNFLHADVPADSGGNTMEWRAGVARAAITPEEPMWMAGYAARERPAEGALHDLWVKVLALEDASGQQVVLITSDVIGFTKATSDRIRDQLEARFGLSRAQVILNSSHTHTGPEVDALKYSWRVSDPDPGKLEQIEQYVKQLEHRIPGLVGEALDALEPARLYAENGVTRFQVNRRNNPESTLNRQTALNGPNDYAVPVIKVVNRAGDLMAVAFGYACHPTVLAGYKWSGDYAGFAQLELEKTYPGVTALFFQGAGGDQNPLPRGTVALAEQYGRSLAAAVERVLNEEMRQLSSRLSTAYSEVDLPFASPLAEDELLEFMEESSGYQNRWARYMLEKRRRGEPLMTSYPYPVQVWKLGDQPVMSLGGEPVTDYAIALKRIFGRDIFVLGYSNDPNMAYIPSARVLKEGGYEGASSQMAKGLPGTWASTIETLILQELVKLAEQAGVPKAGPMLIEH